MIPQKRAATSQQTVEPSPRVKPQPVFARDDSGAGRADVGDERRVLIVEDDYLIAADAQSALTEAGFEVAIAASAEEALQAVAVRQPALVIMDIRLLGRRDGIDLALELFRKHGLRSVFATAHIDREAQMRAEPARPLGWLPKPYTSASLVALVQRVWNRS